jgi:hypothetical protein
VRMDWGERVSLPPDTDGGAVERGEVSISALGPITTEVVEGDLPGTRHLDRLLGLDRHLGPRLDPRVGLDAGQRP